MRQKIKITLRLRHDEMVVATPESRQKVKSAIGIGHFVTQRVVRSEKLKKLIGKEVDGASSTTLQANEVSNLNLTDVDGYRSDAYFRFLVVGRADCVPTPANPARWFGGRIQAERAAQEGGQVPNCQRCAGGQRPTFAHLLNKCGLYAPQMTERHH
jgi:hypothetical protein